MALHVYQSTGIDNDAQWGPLQNLTSILEN